jgi:hypothetical protein
MLKTQHALIGKCSKNLNPTIAQDHKNTNEMRTAKTFWMKIFCVFSALAFT